MGLGLVTTAEPQSPASRSQGDLGLLGWVHWCPKRVWQGKRLGASWGRCSPGGLPDTWLCFQPQLLSMVHVRRFTPTPALMFTTAVALALVLPGNFSIIVNFLRQVRLLHAGYLLALMCTHSDTCTLVHVYMHIHF